MSDESIYVKLLASKVIDSYIKANPSNRDYTHYNELEDSNSMFEVSIDYDVIDNTASPVEMFLKDHKLVGWYDYELAIGFIDQEYAL